MGLSLEALLAKLAGLGGPGGPGKDNLFLDTGKINKFEKPVKSEGKTTMTQITGQRDDKKPGETYIEFKGPTMIGNRSSVGYTKDVLSARKKAEQAIGQKKIPKEHEKRVKQYFESLTKGG